MNEHTLLTHNFGYARWHTSNIHLGVLFYKIYIAFQINRRMLWILDQHNYTKYGI